MIRKKLAPASTFRAVTGGELGKRRGGPLIVDDGERPVPSCGFPAPCDIGAWSTGATDRLGTIEPGPALALHSHAYRRGAAHESAYCLSRLSLDRTVDHDLDRIDARPRGDAGHQPPDFPDIIFREVLDRLENRGQAHRAEIDDATDTFAADLTRVGVGFGRVRGLRLVGGRPRHR